MKSGGVFQAGREEVSKLPQMKLKLWSQPVRLSQDPAKALDRDRRVPKTGNYPYLATPHVNSVAHSEKARSTPASTVPTTISLTSKKWEGNVYGQSKLCRRVEWMCMLQNACLYTAKTM